MEKLSKFEIWVSFYCTAHLIFIFGILGMLLDEVIVKIALMLGMVLIGAVYVLWIAKEGSDE